MRFYMVMLYTNDIALKLQNIHSPEIISLQNKENTEAKPFLKDPQSGQGHFKTKQKVSPSLLPNLLDYTF